MATKRILYLLQSSPYGTLGAQEGLDALLAGSIFDQDISVLFHGNGVYQLFGEQSPGFTRSIHRQLKSLGMYDIENIFVCAHSLAERGVDQQSLAIGAQALTQAEIMRLLRKQDHILAF